MAYWTGKMKNLVYALCDELNEPRPSGSMQAGPAHTLINQLLAKKRQQALDHWKAEQTVKMAGKPAIAEGRYAVDGVIISTKWQTSPAGFEQLKCLVEDEHGNRFFCSIPQSIRDAVSPPWGGLTNDSSTDSYKDCVVNITATWTPGKNDAHFASGYKPVGELIGQTVDRDEREAVSR
jgi:hypothetical protein